MNLTLTDRLDISKVRPTPRQRNRVQRPSVHRRGDALYDLHGIGIPPPKDLNSLQQPLPVEAREPSQIDNHTYEHAPAEPPECRPVDRKRTERPGARNHAQG